MSPYSQAFLILYNISNILRVIYTMYHVLHVIILLIIYKEQSINMYYYVMYYIPQGRFNVLLFESLINLFKHHTTY